MTYEVEIRFIADTPAEAFALIPFLEESLTARKEWDSDIVGESIFHDGRLLRTARGPGDGRLYMGYKGPDIGDFANIRQEWDEEITDGTNNSVILAQVGIGTTFGSSDAVIAALNEAGHLPFMHFSGVDQLGLYEPLAIHTKLACCAAIVGDRVLVELEMGAETKTEARAAEEALRRIAEKYNIVERLDPDEPPTMLFKATSNS